MNWYNRPRFSIRGIALVGAGLLGSWYTNAIVEGIRRAFRWLVS